MSAHIPESNKVSASGSSNEVNRNLVAALAVVTLIAVVVPLLMLAFLRNGDDDSSEIVETGSEIDPAPSPTDSGATESSTVAGATAVPLAPVPTPLPPPNQTSAAPVIVAPVVTQLAGDAPAVFRVTGIAPGAALNVRQAAGTTNALIGTLAGNTTDIAGTGRRVAVDGSEWREIKFKTGTGWVFAGYLALAPAPAAAPTVAPTATVGPVKQLADDAPGVYAVTGVSPGASLNVRAEAGGTQRLLGSLPFDTSAVPSTGRRALVGQTEWREIGFRNATGWVDASFLVLVPEAPKTVQLAKVPSSTVGIVPLTSANDRLAIRVDPGYEKDVVGSVGASAVNITATGRLAQIGTEVWAEITASTTTGWVPNQLIIPNVRSVSDVLASSGVAAVTIDKVNVSADGTVSVQVGTQTVQVTTNTTVTTAAGAQSAAATWAAAAKTGTAPVLAEVTVVGNQITRIWLAA